jgi:hypothetical protein
LLIEGSLVVVVLSQHWMVPVEQESRLAGEAAARMASDEVARRAAVESLNMVVES